VIADGDQRDRFGDAEIVVVSFASPQRLAQHREHLGVPFTFVSDEERVLYRLLGAERGTRRAVWSAGTLRMYAELIRRGRRLRRPSEDVRQLGADAVVGRDGRLRYLALPATPADRPPVDELIRALD
jgi:peroxiredoxin